MQAYLIIDTYNATYADFLQQVIDILTHERNYSGHSTCYICNTLKHPMIDNKYQWRHDNALYIQRLEKTINRKLHEYSFSKERIAYLEKLHMIADKVMTLSFILKDGESSFEGKVRWLKSLIAYHKNRGTSKTFHETRNWLKT